MIVVKKALTIIDLVDVDGILDWRVIEPNTVLSWLPEIVPVTFEVHTRIHPIPSRTKRRLKRRTPYTKKNKVKKIHIQNIAIPRRVIKD